MKEIWTNYDWDFYRRISIISTNSGNSMTSGNGGIWSINKQMFENSQNITKTPSLKNIHDRIQAKFEDKKCQK